MSKLLCANELCAVLGVSRGFLYRCRAEGMPYIRIGDKLIRYDVSEVKKWLDERKVVDTDAE